ncbi:MAG: SIMPL domain-containing protein [Phenylobacterium sp.]|uniref:SIMPL domain-containing protein n=1 Tax=Phenylobacterium sp. TaxID=1871053 RepID=UPI00271615A1|nr:SIMPL domain-containing protein [Phenylobacterium sp.]MDO8902271.1 SIMPL domain-containing protein [Phenylobacterium sp.]
MTATATATALAAALIASSAVAQTPEPIRAIATETPIVNITAEGRSDRAPDLAMFNAGVVAQAKSAAEAMRANTARMNAVVAALRRAGVAERDIQTSALTLQPQYHYPQPVRSQDGTTEVMAPEAPSIIGYEARNTVTVKLRRIAEMGRLMDAMVSAGANQVDGPHFSVEQPDAAADEARADALQKARARADLYARQAGFRTARLLTISEGGGYYPMQRDLQSIVVTGQSYGGAMPAAPPPPPMAPVQPGEVSVGVSLSVQFALER